MNQDFQFLNQLSEEEILALINRCILSINENDNFKEPYVTQINMFAEPERRRENGTRYMHVNTLISDTGKIQHIGSTFEISEFTMAKMNYVNPHLTVDCTDILRIFMTQKFGQEYIQALYELKVQEASQECQKLEQYLSSTRK